MPSWKSQFPVRRASLAAATGFMLGLPSTLPLMAQQQAPGTSAQAAPKSEITRQLEALYERDGRPMPQMVVPRYQPQPQRKGRPARRRRADTFSRRQAPRRRACCTGCCRHVCSGTVPASSIRFRRPRRSSRRP